METAALITITISLAPNHSRQLDTTTNSLRHFLLRPPLADELLPLPESSRASEWQLARLLSPVAKIPSPPPPQTLTFANLNSNQSVTRPSPVEGSGRRTLAGWRLDYTPAPSARLESTMEWLRMEGNLSHSSRVLVLVRV